MDDFLKMDIFFVVATIAVVVVGALVAYALVRLLRILRNVEKLSETVSTEAQFIRTDIDDMRTNIRAEGFKWAHLSRFARASAKRFMGGDVNKK
jgi:hypothetical protein